MLDFPTTGQALWALYDAGGPRPEYILPVLYTESGFDPSTPNLAGAPYYGLGQTSGARLAQAGVDPQDFLTWSASRQIDEFIAPMMLTIVRSYGRLRSGARVYQANFLPATLGSVRRLDGVLARFGDAQGIYAANAGLDWQHNGTITLSDLAHFIARAASSPAVQSAIAQTYALRPGELASRDPVLGEDFGSGLGPFAAATAMAFLVYAWIRS